MCDLGVKIADTVPTGVHAISTDLRHLSTKVEPTLHTIALAHSRSASGAAPTHRK